MQGLSYSCFLPSERSPDCLLYVGRWIPVDPVEELIHVEGASASRFAQLFRARHQAATHVQRVQLARLSRAVPVHPFKRVERVIELPGGQLGRRARLDVVEQDLPTIGGGNRAAIVPVQWSLPVGW